MLTYLKAVTSGIWTFILPFLKILLTQGGQLLAQTAMNTVSAVAANYAAAPGDQKKAIAFDVITASLQKQGVQLGASVINAAIEAAVQRLENIK